MSVSDSGWRSTGRSLKAPADIRQGAGVSWAIPATKKQEYDNRFRELDLRGNKASGPVAARGLAGSGLDQTDLRAIWELADMDHDGAVRLPVLCRCL